MRNILITSAGKRVTLVRLFQKAIKNDSFEGKVYTTDLNPHLAPAGVVSDGCFRVPRVTDKDYINILLDLCLKNRIQVIIPTIDTELEVLAGQKALFRNHHIDILVSDLSFIQMCRDKRKTGTYLEDLGIRIPKSVDKYHPTFPLFAKPYDGSLSKDIYIIKSKEELTTELVNHPKLMFMEYIDGDDYKEFTVDMYYGKDNYVKSIVPRERVEIRAGEINKGYTRKNFLVDLLKQNMDFLPGVVGCICIQLFYRESDDDVVGIEINPRFGGGYPLSYYANANFPQNIVEEYFEGKVLGYTNDWLDGTLMLRYDAEVIVHEEGSSL